MRQVPPLIPFIVSEPLPLNQIDTMIGQIPEQRIQAIAKRITAQVVELLGYKASYVPTGKCLAYDPDGNFWPIQANASNPESRQIIEKLLKNETKQISKAIEEPSEFRKHGLQITHIDRSGMIIQILFNLNQERTEETSRLWFELLLLQDGMMVHQNMAKLEDF